MYLYVDVKTFFVLPDIAQKNSRINKKIIQQGKNKMHEKQIKLILYKKRVYVTNKISKITYKTFGKMPYNFGIIWRNYNYSEVR